MYFLKKSYLKCWKGIHQNFPVTPSRLNSRSLYSNLLLHVSARGSRLTHDKGSMAIRMDLRVLPCLWTRPLCLLQQLLVCGIQASPQPSSFNHHIFLFLLGHRKRLFGCLWISLLCESPSDKNVFQKQDRNTPNMTQGRWPSSRGLGNHGLHPGLSGSEAGHVHCLNSPSGFSMVQTVTGEPGC